MFRTRMIVGSVVAALSLVTNFNLARAQGNAAAATKAVPINMAAAGVDRLNQDIDYVFGLAAEQAAAKELKETLDVFFVGVDPKSPAVFQVYVRKGKFNIVLHAPTLPPAKNFRGNLSQLGLKSRLIAPGMYQLSSLFKGYLKEEKNVSVIAEERADTSPPLPGGLADYKTKLDPQDHDFVASIINDAAQIKDRQDAIEEIRKQVMPGLKKIRNETEPQFELRKLSIDQQLTEIKQIYSEAATIHSITDLVPAKKTLFSQTDLTALPSTELAKAVDDLAKEPSHFANVPFGTSDALSGMINLKLDALRQKHVKSFLVQARPLMQAEIKESENSAKTKDYIRVSTDIIFDVLEKSADAGTFDSFINVHANSSGKHTMVGATKVNGDLLTAGLEKLKESTKVEIKAGKIGDVDLHKIDLPADLTELHEIYGKDLVLILGSSPTAIWYAMGENAEAKLKEAIEKVGQPAPAPNHVVAHLNGRALIWYELFDAHRTKHKKGNADNRQEALKALKAGGDTFEFKMEKTEKDLKTTLTLHEGILRYFGKVGANFVRENIQN